VVPDRGLLREPDFLKLWAGQGISQVGSSITSIGTPILAVSMLNASALGMGVLSGASAAGVLLFGLFAGAWADRLRRRPILIAADLARALAVGSIPLAAVVQRLTMAHLVAVACVSAMLTVLFDVSYQAYLPSLVGAERLVEGNAKLALTESAAEVVGPGFTGVLIQLITAPMAMLFDAASFICSAVSVWSIRKGEPAPERTANPNMRQEIREGLLASWRHPVLRALAGRAATGAFFLGFSGSLYFLLTVKELRLSVALVGTIISIGGASNLVGAAVAERMSRRFGTGRTLILSSLFTGAGWLLVPFAQGPGLLIVAQLGDAGWPLYTIHERSLRQKIAPPEMLGRVNSAAYLLFHGLLPLGAFMGGALANMIGVRPTMLIGGVGYLLSTFWLVGIESASGRAAGMRAGSPS
jgi:MFS family permease